MLEQYPLLTAIIAGRHYLIATDGAAKGNPGPGGWGLIRQLKDGDQLLRQGAEAGHLSGTLDELITTNNRMEMAASIIAAEGIVEVETPAIIMSDSGYVIDGMTKYLPGWIERGWRTADKKPVKNQDLWERLDAACIGKTIHWVKVKGHSGHPLNETADALAGNAAIGKYPKGKQSVKKHHPDWFIA